MGDNWEPVSGNGGGYDDEDAASGQIVQMTLNTMSYFRMIGLEVQSDVSWDDKDVASAPDSMDDPRYDKLSQDD